MSKAHVYRAPKALSKRQRDVLLDTWSSLVYSATEELKRQRPSIARLYAKDARDLVGAFGVRWDGKRIKRSRQS